MTRTLASLLLLHLIVAPVAFAAAAVKVQNQELPDEGVLNANLNVNLNVKIPSAQQQQQQQQQQNDRTLQQAECNTSTSAPFEANIVVDLRGYPGLLRWKEKRRVGTAIMAAYNELVSCGTGGPYRQITSVQVDSVSFEDVGEATFTLKYAIQGTCQGCTVASNGITRLFTYVDRNTAHGATSGVTAADPCPCQGPSIFSFRVLLKQRIELMILNKLTAGNILGLEQVSELESSPTCQDSQTFSTSSVAILFYGCPSKVEDWEFDDIGDKFVEVYNRINGQNARLCDPYFRQIESAIPVVLGGNITTVPSDVPLNRALQASASNETCDEYFEVRYEITASCRNCDPSKITLFDEPDAVNFFLQGEDDDEDDDQSDNDSDRKLMTAQYDWDSNQHHQEDEEGYATRFLDQSSDCQCPLDTAFRAATEDEMTAALGPSISLSTSLTVEDVVEIVPISCDPDVESFETSVDVDYEFESEDGTVPQEAAAAFVANFLLSYNSLQARYCDPYFREVATAEIADQSVVPSRRDRALQTKKPTKFTVTLKVAVVGTCRGCTGTTRKLFVNDAARRLQVSEKRMLPEKRSNPKFRRIESEDQCFCAVANVANSAPTEREFLVGYNGELSSLTPQLGVEYVVTTVNEEGGEGVDDNESRQECTADLDCVNSEKGDLCVNFSCIHAGNPRVTLTWTGDDDLDLAVYTPDGVRIYYDYDFDEDTGGSFDTLFSQEAFAPHVESIYFPIKGAPAGTYNIEVSSWEERDSADAWKVEVFTAASGSVPAFVTTGTGNRDDILFDFGEAGVSVKDDICSTSNARTECCFDTDCNASNQRCANRQCVTTGARTFTLTWSGNDDHTLTVLTPKGGRISDDAPLDPFSGAVFEADNNWDAVIRSSHTENIYFPGGYPGGQYVFYVDAIAQLGAADEWSLEVIEFGESVLLETGYGYSKVFEYIAPECQSNQHCRKGSVCINTRCVVDGTLRFTLTWDGDDDLDLSVSPPIGNRVDWWNQFDSRSGGTLQDDTTPTGTSHLESIYFGVSRRALTGRYRIDVSPYETYGDASDPWKLDVSVRGKVVKSWTGTGEASLRYWYGG